MVSQKKAINKSSVYLVQQHLPIIKLFAKTKNHRIRQELLTLSPETVEAISSIILNIKNGNVQLSNKKQKSLLMKLNKDIEIISNPALSIKRKKALLLQRHNQKGGLAPLLAAAIPGIISAIGAITSAAINKRSSSSSSS